VIASAAPSDAGSYTLEVTNPNGTATSAAANLTVNADTTKPTVVSVSGGTTPTSVTIVFSKPVSAATAQNTANYSINPTLAISSAVLSADGTTVTLTTAARTVGTHYVITIRDIRDTRQSQNLLNPNPTQRSLPYQVATPLLAFTDVWKYEQSGTDLGTDWRASGYNDSAWPSGPGILGFETTSNTLFFMRTIALPDGTNTVLSLTNNAGQTNPTIYFRTTFNNPFTPAFGVTYTMRAYVDDGAVWYVNGAESGRYNITNGPVSFNTRANGALAEPNPNPQTTFITRTLSGVVSGLNHIAVEVHQDALTSSDIDWGAEIVATIEGPTLQILRSGGNVTISWVGAGTLQEAPAVTGPWSNSASQTNPQTRAAGGTMRYFRLLVSP
jgi:hypothetical protein